MMDIRRPMLEYDMNMLIWANSRNLPVHVVLNKSDKLKHGQASSALLKTRQQLKQINPDYTVQIFSALKGTGIDELKKKLNIWFENEPDCQ